MTMTHKKFHEILTVAPVGLNVYFVIRGFCVDNPSNCNAAVSAIVAPNVMIYFRKLFIFSIGILLDFISVNFSDMNFP